MKRYIFLLLIPATVILYGCYTQKTSEQEKQVNKQQEREPGTLKIRGEKITDIRRTAKLTDYEYFIFGELKNIPKSPLTSTKYKYFDIPYRGMKEKVESVFHTLGYTIIDEQIFEEMTPDMKKKVLTCDCYYFSRITSKYKKYRTSGRWWRETCFLINLRQDKNWVFQARREDYVPAESREGPSDRVITEALAKIIASYVNLKKE